MKKSVLAIYEQDVEYAMKLMDYVNHKKGMMLEACVFTNEKSLMSYMDVHKVDILLLGEVCSTDALLQTGVSHTVILSEKKYAKKDFAFPTFYKYQSIEHLLQEILALMLDENNRDDTCLLVGKKARTIGFFTATGDCGQSNVCLALGQRLTQKERVLYLSFELLPGLGRESGRKEEYFRQGMSELLYYVKKRGEQLALKIETITENVGGVSCVYPVEHYGDLYELETQDVEFLFDTLYKKTNYDTILLDVGFMGESAWTLLEMCDMVVAIQAAVTAAKIKIEGLFRMLHMEGRDGLCEKMKVLSAEEVLLMDEDKTAYKEELHV